MDLENYTISILGKQQVGDESDEIAVDTVGTYREEDGYKYINYREYEENGTFSSIATLKIENNTLTMCKDGSRTMLVLEKGKRHNCMYDTGYGSLMLGVYTTELVDKLSKDGGTLNISYTLDVDTNLASRNELKIELKYNNEGMK